MPDSTGKFGIAGDANRPVGGKSYIERFPPLLLSGYRADFSRDTRIRPAVYHLIISREGEREILGFAQATSLEEAIMQARGEIEALARTARGSAEGA